MRTSQISAEEDRGPRVDRAPLRRFIRLTIAWAIGLLLIGDHILSLFWYLSFASYAAVQMQLQARRLTGPARRAIQMVAAGAVLAVVGLAVRALHALLSNDPNPFPSVAEVFNLSSYVVFIATVVWIVRCRVKRLGADPILDATVGAVAAALLQWTLVILSYLEVSDVPTIHVIVNLTYSFLSLLLVMVAVLALVAGSTPSPSNRLLAAALVTLFTADVVAVLGTVGRAPDELGLLFAPLALVLGTAGVLQVGS